MDSISLEQFEMFYISFISLGLVMCFGIGAIFGGQR
ncbi:tail virion protein G7P-2 [Providencia rettgeri]|nr:tail virion protein G7P-2 [Providencia huaxiensis]